MSVLKWSDSPRGAGFGGAAVQVLKDCGISTLTMGFIEMLKNIEIVKS